MFKIQFIKISLLLTFLTCASCVSVSGPPFVKADSGVPFATLKSYSGLDKAYQLWIGPVDNKFARKSIFGEDMFAGEEVYVAAGVHTVGLRCHNTGVNRYATIIIEFEALAAEAYQFRCGANDTNQKAVFFVYNSKGEQVNFKVVGDSWYKKK